MRTSPRLWFVFPACFVVLLTACTSPRPEPRPGTISINTGGIGGPNIEISGIDNNDDTEASIRID